MTSAKNLNRAHDYGLMSATVTVLGRQRGTFCKTSFFQTSSTADPGFLRVPQCRWVTRPDVSKKQCIHTKRQWDQNVYILCYTEVVTTMYFALQSYIVHGVGRISNNSTFRATNCACHVQ